MNLVFKVTSIAALAAAIGFAALTATPAKAQGFYHPHQYHHADRLNRRAAVAASHGRFGRAARLDRHAAALRAAARHGY